MAFCKGADGDLTKTQKACLFKSWKVYTLTRQRVLLGMKNKSLNKMYKGLTESVVKEAFGWNDKFVRPEPEQK